MGAGSGKAPVHVPFQTVYQRFGNGFPQKPFIGAAYIRVIKDLQRFLSAAHVIMKASRFPGKRPAELRPVRHKPGAQFTQLLVPQFQHVILQAIRLFQQVVSLLQGDIVLLQGVIICGLELAEFHVQKPAPLLRAALNKHQILRRKHDHIQAAHQFSRTLQRRSVQTYFFSFA